MHPQHPSDCHPDLQEERLLALADFFASTRSVVAALHDPLVQAFQHWMDTPACDYNEKGRPRSRARPFTLPFLPIVRD